MEQSCYGSLYTFKRESDTNFVSDSILLLIAGTKHGTDPILRELVNTSCAESTILVPKFDRTCKNVLSTKHKFISDLLNTEPFLPQGEDFGQSFDYNPTHEKRIAPSKVPGKPRNSSKSITVGRYFSF